MKNIWYSIFDSSWFFIERCFDPSKVTNARVIGYDVENSTKVEFFCDKEDVLIPANSTKLMCENGQWKGIIPRCKGRRTLQELKRLRLQSHSSCFHPATARNPLL